MERDAVLDEPGGGPPAPQAAPAAPAPPTPSEGLGVDGEDPRLLPRELATSGDDAREGYAVAPRVFISSRATTTRWIWLVPS